MRRYLALQLYRLAYWLYPDSEASTRFLQKMLWNQLLYGKSVVSIDQKEFYKESN